MKLKSPVLAVMMLMSIVAFGKNAPIEGVHPRPKKQFIIGAVISSASCGLAIGLSANPATAAEIGVPILIGGNYVAYRLYQNHPRWSAVVQALSPLGCALGGLHKPTKPPVKTSTTLHPNSDPPPSGGSGSGNPGSGGSGSGSGGSGSGSGGTGGSGSGGSGAGNPPPSGGGNPPPAPCTVHGGTDCGFGNGGFNLGGNGKPPVEPPGDPHTHGKLW